MTRTRLAATLVITEATPADAEAIAGLRAAAAEHLTEAHGRGPWSTTSVAKSVFSNPGRSRIFLAWRGNAMVATFKLAQKKPWAIDVAYFSSCSRPLYLVDMSVDPSVQRQGVGRRCLEEAVTIAREWPADAIRLDTYDADAGAGPFYRRCGFREVGRVVYRKAPLIYFETLVHPVETRAVAKASPREGPGRSP